MRHEKKKTITLDTQTDTRTHKKRRHKYTSLHVWCPIAIFVQLMHLSMMRLESPPKRKPFAALVTHKLRRCRGRLGHAALALKLWWSACC